MLLSNDWANVARMIEHQDETRHPAQNLNIKLKADSKTWR